MEGSERLRVSTRLPSGREVWLWCGSVAQAVARQAPFDMIGEQGGVQALSIYEY